MEEETTRERLAQPTPILFTNNRGMERDKRLLSSFEMCARPNELQVIGFFSSLGRKTRISNSSTDASSFRGRIFRKKWRKKERRASLSEIHEQCCFSFFFFLKLEKRKNTDVKRANTATEETKERKKKGGGRGKCRKEIKTGRNR